MGGWWLVRPGKEASDKDNGFTAIAVSSLTTNGHFVILWLRKSEVRVVWLGSLLRGRPPGQTSAAGEGHNATTPIHFAH